MFFEVETSEVDRGKQSLETICILLAYKIKYRVSSCLSCTYVTNSVIEDTVDG